ncbi:MAG: hypothetical protein Q9216_004428 [Gyalolechia sp. 2 TL-2023]
MNPSFLFLLFQVTSLLPPILAGPLDWRQEPESGHLIAAGLQPRDLVSRSKGKLSKPHVGLVARQQKPETPSARSTQQGSEPTSQVTQVTASSSTAASVLDSTNTRQRASRATPSNSPKSGKGTTQISSSGTASTTSRSSSAVTAGSEQPTATGSGTVIDSSGSVAQTTSSPTGAEAPDSDTTVLTDATQPTSGSTAEGSDVSDVAMTTSGALPTSSSVLETDDAPAYNQQNVACRDYWSMKSPDKWNATDGDSTVRTFVDMYTADKLFCEDCFGRLKSQCDSDNVTCKHGIRTRATPDSEFGPSWSVAAAWFAQYGKADHFTCQIGTENECPHAPECKDTDGAGAAALLEAISKIFISFQENYDALSRAGDLCDMQMQHFSDVFAPVPDSEGEAMAIIVLTALVGGLAGFLTGPAGALAGMAAGLGSGIGMERFFASRPGPKDTSSSLGVIVGAVLDTYGNMTNELFHDGEYTHASSDGKSDVKLSLAALMADGGAMITDADPRSHFTGLVPSYQRLLFQQLALVTWQHLAVDDKNHVPFIAFDKGPCDQVDGEQENTAAHMIEGLNELESYIDFQGDCYYLLDAYPSLTHGPVSKRPRCDGAHHLPGGTNKVLKEENADKFRDLSIEDFIIPSVLGWQNHSNQNGYESALSSGNLVSDPQDPGVVNIPVCDYITDFDNPGVGCPRLNKYPSDQSKCDLVPISEGHNQPGEYQQGGCRAHVVQWQKNGIANNANQLPDYQLSVDIYDQNGRRVGSATKQSAAQPIEVDNTALPYNLIVAAGGVDDDPVTFWYADQYWASDETENNHQCRGGGGPNGGGGYDNGARQIDCGFDCPLDDPDVEPPASATIDHPLPATPVVAVPGPSSYANTYSKTAPAAATVTPDYLSGVCRMKITQYQRNDEDSNPTNDYQIEINVTDGEGNQAANFPKQPCPSGEPKTMKGLKAGNFDVIVGKNLEGDLGDLDKISFTYGGQEFDTDSLKCLHGEKGQYEDGDRELNCNINC